MRGLVDRLTLQDQRVIVALAVRPAPRWLDRLLRGITHLGGTTVTVGICLALLLPPDGRRLGLDAGFAVLLSHLVVQALKRTVVRRRPSALLPGIRALTDLPDHYSFPSGHACAAMALATTVSLAQPLPGFLLLMLALVVGGSRVYLRVHYVTDVVVGQMLGAGTAILVSLRPA